MGPARLIRDVQTLLPYVQFCPSTPMQEAMAVVIRCADQPYQVRACERASVLCEGCVRACACVRHERGLCLLRATPMQEAMAAVIRRADRQGCARTFHTSYAPSFDVVGARQI